MCLIIQREPNVVIPYEKFKNSVINNPNGFGLSVPDEDGMLHTIRDPSVQDPEKLYRLVQEEFKDAKILLHLRYTTAGATNLRNAHPFPILERDTDGVDLRMAHNGTLFKYKPVSPSTESDTRVFVRSYIRPLFKRLILGMDSVDILNDDFVKEMLEDKLTTQSVLSFIDGNGNTLNVNGEGNGGKQDEGWYYSNTYSFNPDHRVKTVSHYNNGYPRSAQEEWDDWEGYVKAQGRPQAVGFNQQQKPSNITTTGNKVVVIPSAADKIHAGDTRVSRFTNKYATTVAELYAMSDTFINTLVTEQPEDAGLLIKELLAMTQSMKQKNDGLEAQIAVLKLPETKKVMVQ
jgi:hypothetical protein